MTSKQSCRKLDKDWNCRSAGSPCGDLADDALDAEFGWYQQDSQGSQVVHQQVQASIGSETSWQGTFLDAVARETRKTAEREEAAEHVRAQAEHSGDDEVIRRLESLASEDDPDGTLSCIRNAAKACKQLQEAPQQPGVNFSEAIHKLSCKSEDVLESSFNADMDLLEFEQLVLPAWLDKKRAAARYSQQRAAVTGMMQICRRTERFAAEAQGGEGHRDDDKEPSLSRPEQELGSEGSQIQASQGSERFEEEEEETSEEELPGLGSMMQVLATIDLTNRRFMTQYIEDHNLVEEVCRSGDLARIDELRRLGARHRELQEQLALARGSGQGQAS